MKYRIPCSWEMYGIMEVEADDIEEAVEFAEAEGELPNGDYVDGSFAVDHDLLEFYNNEESLRS